MKMVNSNSPCAMVFLAEDDPDDQLLFMEGFKSCCQNAELVIFGDGFELMAHLRELGKKSGGEHALQPNIIFLDLNMPGKSGMTVLEELKASGLDDIVVVVWTTTDDPDTIARCYQLGADLFVTKPLSFDDIARRIQDAVSRFL